jgi:hypothetical protein
MKKKIIVLILFGLSSGAFAHEVVHQESQGGWTSYRIRCDNGQTRYIAQNPDGFWARGKNYAERKDAMAAACGG